MKTNSSRKAVLLAAIAGAIVLFWVLDLDRYLTLDYLKGSLAEFRPLHARHRFAVIVGYFLIYVVTAALSLPGAAVLTLAGGALFGFLTGTIVVSFASSMGATLACFAARFVLRDWVQGRFGETLVRINEGMDREGAFYLFTLRLIPVFPFWMINLVMGLTEMSFWKFYWVSQLGMLPGTMVYVNAGTELAKVGSVRGIVSPGLLLSLALLGVFPIAVKKALALYRRKKGSASPGTDARPREENNGEP